MSQEQAETLVKNNNNYSNNAENLDNDTNMSNKSTNNPENTTQDGQAEDNISNENNTIETLKQQLEALKQKADQNYDLAVRAKAELENVRKRADQEVTKAHKYALERFIPELFPLLDGLDQGLNTLGDDANLNQVREGLSLSIKMFNDVLVKFGVEVIDPVNQPFDPAKHEAISMQVTKDYEAGMVMAVVQKGYLLNERVLRPARVVVAQSQ